MNGHGTLRLITRLTGTMATVEIWDDGPGIDPAIQSRIFEPFFTTKAPGQRPRPRPRHGLNASSAVTPASSP